MFVMTNNELLTASQHPQQYFMCIVHQTDKKIEMCLIKDPANTLNLENEQEYGSIFVNHTRVKKLKGY